MLASAREWEAVPLDRIGGRAGADALLRVAQRARIDLKIGGPEGEAVLVNGVDRLRTRHVVGVIAAGQTRLEILPKIDGLDDGAARARLVRMIAGALDLRIAEGELTELGSSETDLLEVIVRLFCARVTALARRGLPRGYVDRADDLPFLRGRLDLGRQLTRMAIAPTPLACTYDELSPDIPLNRVIKAAVVLVARMTKSAANRRRLHELEALFEEVATIAPDRLPTATIILDRTQRRWAEALKLARLLLERNFQTVTAGADRGFALLFDMNTLFEAFIGRNLRRALEDTDLTVTLQGPKRHALTEEGRGRFRTKPDIVVHRAGRPVLVVDTKWKRVRSASVHRRRGVSEADVYQIMAYGHVYHVSALMLLYPHYAELEEAPGSHAEFSLARGAGQLSIATVSLTRLEGLRDHLRALVSGAIDPAAPLKASSAPLA